VKKETNRAPLGTYISVEPREREAVDIFGPLPLTKQGITYILVISDLFTKWTEAIAIPNQESTTICQAFVDNVITKYGTPLQIHSDQRRNFQSDTLKGICTGGPKISTASLSLGSTEIYVPSGALFVSFFGFCAKHRSHERQYFCA
jgi:hypothetical protein